MPPILGIWASAFAKTAPDTGSYFPLGEFTLASAASNVEFTNIPQTYTHLQIRYSALPSSTSGTYRIRMQVNADTGNNYAAHLLLGNGSSATASAGSSLNQITAGPSVQSGSTSNPAVGVIDLLDYKNTNKNKTVRILSGYDSNGSGEVAFNSGLWMNTNAITSIKLYFDTANLSTNSTISLYGVLA